MKNAALRKLFAQLARESKRAAADRLRAGRDVNGRALPRKKESDGRPLGGNLPSLIMQGVIRVASDGFRIVYRSKPLLYFQLGNSRQRPRPVLGHDRQQRLRMARQIGDAIEADMRRTKAVK